MTPLALWTAFQTIVLREIRRFTRIWPQTLLPPAVTMTLYFIIFGNLIGSRIGDMGGFDYMQFIVPGLIMMSVITSSYANVVSSFFSMKFQRSIEELLVSPVPNWTILAGYVVGGMSRGLIIGLIVTLLSLAFTQLAIHNLPMVVITVFLTSALFSLGGFINAMLATKFDDISIVPTFVLTPLTYLGGVFYSIDLLPALWQNVSLANPILYMVNGFRYGILGVSDVNPFVSLGMILVFIVLLSAVALRMLARGKGIRH
ncbi:inner membrane transport permease YadH [Marinobacter sp. JH2]|uniref:ABC transporter permease n=1 Tax=Marinobacter sp. AL4B TaxID=2871173 RepID=UPI00105474F7|nr:MULTISPECIES: ABC transporter permease [unclassified Marinobacter]MBZ0332808.1 ABC transporter permease [Marinobacter sp. AL4B]QBM16756.1 inner membrane transport permease YadH [Marinobacter sp. JH2]